MTFDIQEILGFLPHRYPFLLIDRIVEFESKKRLVAIKNVTINEPFFQGHFPGYPIMPAVLVIEAMAQAGAIIMMSEIPDREKKLAVFTGIDKAKFRNQVTPGDQLRIEVNVLAFRSRMGRMEARATVDGKLACEAILSCAIVPRVREPNPPAERAFIPAPSSRRAPWFRSPARLGRFAPSGRKWCWARAAHSSPTLYWMAARASARGTSFIPSAQSALRLRI